MLVGLVGAADVTEVAGELDNLQLAGDEQVARAFGLRVEDHLYEEVRPQYTHLDEVPRGISLGRHLLARRLLCCSSLLRLHGIHPHLFPSRIARFFWPVLLDLDRVRRWAIERVEAHASDGGIGTRVDEKTDRTNH